LREFFATFPLRTFEPQGRLDLKSPRHRPRTPPRDGERLQLVGGAALRTNGQKSFFAQRIPVGRLRRGLRAAQDQAEQQKKDRETDVYHKED
jgi:hypothetical protein